MSRPERVVILLRGLPGSGKSRLARLIKQEEVAHGGSPPRVLCLDDYFYTEHEDSGEMVYAYDAEVDAAYRASETRAFIKALEVRRGAGNFHSVLVIDNCNLTHAEMRPYVEAAQVAGAALYVHTCTGEAGMGSVEECAARSEHDWSLAQVEGTVSGDVSALGGLMDIYARKRVRWADEEAAKDEDFQRTKAGFTLRGAAPLKRQRIRSPPPEDRAEAGDD